MPCNGMTVVVVVVVAGLLAGWKRASSLHGRYWSTQRIAKRHWCIAKTRRANAMPAQTQTRLSSMLPTVTMSVHRTRRCSMKPNAEHASTGIHTCYRKPSMYWCSISALRCVALRCVAQTHTYVLLLVCSAEIEQIIADNPTTHEEQVCCVTRSMHRTSHFGSEPLTTLRLRRESHESNTTNTCKRISCSNTMSRWTRTRSNSSRSFSVIELHLLKSVRDARYACIVRHHQNQTGLID
jgi:hypothetical protein